MYKDTTKDVQYYLADALRRVREYGVPDAIIDSYGVEVVDGDAWVGYETQHHTTALLDIRQTIRGQDIERYCYFVGVARAYLADLAEPTNHDSEILACYREHLDQLYEEPSRRREHAARPGRKKRGHEGWLKQLLRPVVARTVEDLSAKEYLRLLEHDPAFIAVGSDGLSITFQTPTGPKTVKNSTITTVISQIRTSNRKTR